MLPIAPTTATDPNGSRVLTRQEAAHLDPYEAIDRWRNREPGFHETAPEYHLEELALMTVAAEWLTRGQPVSVHRAILAGATPAQVADAAGISVRDVYERWQKWADTERSVIIGGRPSISEEAFVMVLTRFAEAFGGPLKP
jgi:hypothetical protein